MIFDSKGWHVKDGSATDSMKAVGGFDTAHVKNFVDCIRENKIPNAEIEEGHKSTRLCHLGNIAHRTGRTLNFDAAAETIVGDPEATKLLGREYRKGFELPKV